MGRISGLMEGLPFVELKVACVLEKYGGRIIALVINLCSMATSVSMASVDTRVVTKS